MKRFTIMLVICFLTICSYSQSTYNPRANTLILAHPTENNIRLFDYMVDNKIINVRNLEVIGIYHAKEVYDYSKSEKLLETGIADYIRLQKITEDITEDVLYTKNSCSLVFTELFNNSKGILFLGGPDLPPSIYNEETNLLTEITDPYRHYFEASFLFHLLGGSQNPEFKGLLESRPDYTIYGICLGMQTINVATGGSMIQDIPTEIYKINSVEEVLQQSVNFQHRNYNTNKTISEELFPGNFHEIIILDTKPFLGSVSYVGNPLVYSNHHQALEIIGKDLEVIAESFDRKVIEAIRHRKYPNVLGVQFHPEGTMLYNSELKYKKTADDEAVSGYKLLVDYGSYEFHLAFWQEFSRKISQ